MIKAYSIYYVTDGEIFSQLFEVEAYSKEEALDKFLLKEIPHKYVAMILEEGEY